MSSTQQNLTQGAAAGTAEASAQRNDPALRPAIDVFETADGITLYADMPGVSKDHLKLQIEGNMLTVEGELQLRMSGQMDALYADVARRSTAAALR
jgi:HSP20 family protein